MGPLPTGPRNLHIQKSLGADTNIMKFYITQNSSTYGKHWQNFKPRMGRHQGTGYSSNFRPQVYYSAELDKLDNPTMGRICAANYHTITEMSFQPHKDADGREPLPSSVYHAKTGFVRQKPITNPTDAEARGVFVDTRVASAPASILPKGKALLHKIQPKDPIDLENYGYGPAYMVTETKERFKGKQAPHDYDMNYMSVGPLTESGFTHNVNIEPVTFYPNNPHLNDKPGWFTYRPTGISITKTCYNPWAYLQGGDVNPGVTEPSDRNTGFTRELPKPAYASKEPGEDSGNPLSTYKDHYIGKQRADLTHPDKLHRTMMGPQQLSGFSENNDRFVKQVDDPRRFITDYMTRFWDKNPEGPDRLGHTRGGVQRHRPDGFTYSTSLHNFGPDLDNTDTLRCMEPYQARSIKARDEFYDDHTYDSKKHVTFTPVSQVTRNEIFVNDVGYQSRIRI